jgi:hypothetical protein
MQLLRGGHRWGGPNWTGQTGVGVPYCNCCGGAHGLGGSVLQLLWDARGLGRSFVLKLLGSAHGLGKIHSATARSMYYGAMCRVDVLLINVLGAIRDDVIVFCNVRFSGRQTPISS